jgi:hypothetical protein
MEGFEQLGPAERVGIRPFTDPEHSHADLRLMQRILAYVSRWLDLPHDWPAPPQPLVFRHTDDSGLHIRIVVCDRERLAGLAPLHLVGFFGHRRPDRDTSVLDALDEDLIHEFPHHPGLLGYNTFQQGDGNYVNVVIMADPGTADHWRTSAKHAYAARDLAPDYYATVRLHNALLPRGLTDLDAATLLNTKYYDFLNGGWRGYRSFNKK